MTIHTGSKFFRFIDDSDEPEIIRVLKVNNNKKVVRYLDDAGNKCIMSLSKLDDYKMLKADGMIMFSIVRVGDIDDVIVSLSKVPNESNLPYAVCRQSIFDFFSNNTNGNDNVIFVGVSVSQDTCPANIDFQQILSCNGVEYNKPIVVYIDDTLDDILSLFRHEKFNKVLKDLIEVSNSTFKDKIVTGYCKSISDLLTDNNFMYDFRKCFNIMEIPGSIDPDDNELSKFNIDFLSNELKENITKTYTIKYTKEIDLKSIVRDYVLVSSASDKFSDVYIVGYDKN